MTEELNRKALEEIDRRCHAARITPRQLCWKAGVAYTTYWRGKKEPSGVSVTTLGKLEGALALVERAQSLAGL